MYYTANRASTEKRRAMERVWRVLDRDLTQHVGEGICLAVSGGPDSRALMECVASWPGRSLGGIAVVCVDHGMRETSAVEANYVVSRAMALGFPAQVKRLYPVIRSDEAGLRSLRYQALWDAARHFDCKALVTAHHRDDNIEGQLLYWLGAGGAGHGSMGAAIASDSGLILRPFISLRRSALYLALSAVDGEDYFLDPSNELGGARAQVRQHVLPSLHKYRVDIGERLYEIGRRGLRDKKLINEIVVAYPLNNDGQSVWFDYSKAPSELVSRLVLRSLRMLNPEADLRMSYRNIERIFCSVEVESSAFSARSGRQRKFDFPGICVTVSSDRILLEKVKEQ